jgi:ABC-type transport system substrate-binding protein
MLAGIEAPHRTPRQRRLWLAVALAALTSCSIFDPAVTPMPEQAAGQPQRGGTYRLAGPFDAITLDPARADGVEDWWLVGTLLFNRLYSYDADGKLFPDLAEDFPQVSEDSLTHTIRLRRGVAFHNGRELSADDVRFTFERVLNPATASWGVAALMHIAGSDAVANGSSASLAGVRALDAHTLQITLKRPLAAFTALLATSPLSIVPRAEVTTAGSDWGNGTVIGTGPFALAEWTPGERMRLTRNQRYFRLNLPYLDAVEVAFNVVTPVALERWQDGEADFVWFNAAAEEMPQLAADPALTHYWRTSPTLVSRRVVFNTTNKYAADARVRRAMASAINRDALAVLAPLAQASASMLPSLSPQFDADFEAVPHDPNHARQLLAEAGYADGIADMVIVSREPSAQVERIQADLRAVGIQTRLVSGDMTAIAEGVRAGEVAFAYTSHRLNVPDAYAAFASHWRCAPGEMRNPFQPCDAGVSALMAQAERLPLDSAERTAVYQDMQDSALNDNMNQLIVMWTRAAGLASDKTRNDRLHPMHGLPILESAWLVQR